MSQDKTTRWLLGAIAGITLVLGWLFIFWQNNFHVTVSVVVIALAYFAVVAAIGNLWRVGAAAVSPEDDSPGAWSRPIGARDELEKEKKTLLKAIKEAEFDHAMGKLSKQDADELIRMYRGRAIEVIKEIDRLDAGAAGSTREQIQREVQARLAVDNKSGKKDKKKPAKAEEPAPAVKAEAPAPSAKVEEPAPAAPSPEEAPPMEAKSDTKEAIS